METLYCHASALADYARQIKIDNGHINELTYAKTQICALIGKLSPAMPPGERGQGRGGKKSPSPTEVDLAPATIALYRKLDKGKSQVREYHDLLNAINEELDTAVLTSRCTDDA